MIFCLDWQQVIQAINKNLRGLIGNKSHNFTELPCILLDQELDSKLLESLSKSSLMKFLTKYIANVNITTAEGSTVFKKVTALIKNLDQVYLYLWTKNLVCKFQINQFLRVFNYVENSLYAADLIENCTNFIIHMKNLAVEKCQIKDDTQQLAAMQEYYQQSGNSAQAKMQNILSQISTIKDNQPQEATNSIFIRYDFDRIDCMRTLIFGASGTPSAHEAFLYLMFFGDEYPTRPPKNLIQIYIIVVKYV